MSGLPRSYGIAFLIHLHFLCSCLRDFLANSWWFQAFKMSIIVWFQSTISMSSTLLYDFSWLKSQNEDGILIDRVSTALEQKKAKLKFIHN